MVRSGPDDTYVPSISASRGDLDVDAAEHAADEVANTIGLLLKNKLFTSTRWLHIELRFCEHANYVELRRFQAVEALAAGDISLATDPSNLCWPNSLESDRENP